MPSLVVLGARNLGGAILGHHLNNGWRGAAVAQSPETLETVRAAGGAAAAGRRVRPRVAARGAGAGARRVRRLDLIVNAVSAARPTKPGPFGGGPLGEASLEDFRGWTGAVAEQAFVFLSEGVRAGASTLIQVTGGSARRAMAGPRAVGRAAPRPRARSSTPRRRRLRADGIHVALLIVDATIDSPKTAAMIAGRPENETADMAEIARAVEYLAGQSAARVHARTRRHAGRGPVGALSLTLGSGLLAGSPGGEFNFCARGRPEAPHLLRRLRAAPAGAAGRRPLLDTSARSCCTRPGSCRCRTSRSRTSTRRGWSGPTTPRTARSRATRPTGASTSDENVVWAYEDPIAEAAVAEGLRRGVLQAHGRLAGRGRAGLLEPARPVPPRRRVPELAGGDGVRERRGGCAVRRTRCCCSRPACRRGPTSGATRSSPRSRARRSEPRCPYKGEAGYWSLPDVEDAAWSYEAPLPEAAGIAGHVAFDPALVDGRAQRLRAAGTSLTISKPRPPRTGRTAAEPRPARAPARADGRRGGRGGGRRAGGRARRNRGSVSSRRSSTTHGGPRLLHAAQLLVERVRVSEVQLAAQRDPYRIRASSSSIIRPKPVHVAPLLGGCPEFDNSPHRTVFNRSGRYRSADGEALCPHLRAGARSRRLRRVLRGARLRAARQAAVRDRLQPLHGPAGRRRHARADGQHRAARSRTTSATATTTSRSRSTISTRCSRQLAEIGVEPEKPPFAPGGRPGVGRICFVQDPDGYRIELIDGGEFKTPQDSDPQRAQRQVAAGRQRVVAPGRQRRARRQPGVAQIVAV